MSHNIEIQNDSHYPDIDHAQLQKAILTVLQQQEEASDSGVTVVFTDDARVRELNKQHRGTDAPTDVLSFPADPLPPEIMGEDDVAYLGDLIIAFPYTQAQAKRLGHDLGDTLALLVIHGTLHLLGYDHDTPENRAEMWSAQAIALSAMGISDVIVPALEDADHA
ncbi:MAG: rRNA maturation RNase YbeY [Chloroflexota bacterium]